MNEKDMNVVEKETQDDAHINTANTEVTSTATSDDDSTVLQVRSVGLVYLALLISMAASALEQTIISTALPTIVGDLDGVDHMLWVTTGYVLASTIGMPIYGKIGDLIGRRGLFIFAEAMFLIGSIICGAALNMPALIIGRGIQGFGGGGLMVLSQAIVADIIPARKRGLYLNAMGIAWALPMLVGPLLGGLFTDTVSWRWSFWINIPLAGTAIVIAAMFLPKYPNRQSLSNFDGWGIFTIAGAVTTLTLATSWAGVRHQWNSPLIIGLLIATVVFAVLFIFAEKHAREPLMPLTLFHNRNFVLATVGGFIVLFALMAAMSYLPTFFQLAHGMGATEAGYMVLPASALYFFASLFSGAWIAKRGTYKILMAASFIIAAAGAIGMCTLKATTSPFVACGYLTVMGFGMGLSFEILVLIVQNEFPGSMVGTATSATNFFREIGTTMGASVAGAVFTGNLTRLLAERLAPLGGSKAIGTSANALTPAIVHSLPDNVRQTVETAYNDALVPLFVLVVPLAVLAGILMLMLKENPLSETLEGQDK